MVMHVPVPLCFVCGCLAVSGCGCVLWARACACVGGCGWEERKGPGRAGATHLFSTDGGVALPSVQGQPPCVHGAPPGCPQHACNAQAPADPCSRRTATQQPNNPRACRPPRVMTRMPGPRPARRRRSRATLCRSGSAPSQTWWVARALRPALPASGSPRPPCQKGSPALAASPSASRRGPCPEPCPSLSSDTQSDHTTPDPEARSAVLEPCPLLEPLARRATTPHRTLKHAV